MKNKQKKVFSTIIHQINENLNFTLIVYLLEWQQ